MSAATWLEFEVVGPIETMKYRTNANATIVQFWSKAHVPGKANPGWNRTKSETVAMRARAAIAKTGGPA